MIVEPSVLNSVTFPASAATVFGAQIDHLSLFIGFISVVGPDGTALTTVIVRTASVR